jgi:hypothetical protein
MTQKWQGEGVISIELRDGHAGAGGVRRRRALTGGPRSEHATGEQWGERAEGYR